MISQMSCMVLIAMMQEVKITENTVVEHELELAISRKLQGIL